MSRTNLKQQLMREQLEQEERREAIQLRFQRQRLQQQQQHSLQSSPSLQHQQMLKAQTATRLEKATNFHLILNNNNNKDEEHHRSNAAGQSTIAQHTQPPQSPFPLSPDSPISAPHSSASEFDEVWEDLKTLGLEHVNELMEPSMQKIPSTLPTDMLMFGGTASLEDSQHSQTSKGSPNSHLSTSCPPLTDAQIQAWHKERQKKDNHNKIERRRRYNINDRIKELGTLLPKTEDTRYFEIVRDMKQNKGTILKASVDYMKCLKKENLRIPDLERKQRELEMENKRMLLRIKQLEEKVRVQNMQNMHCDNNADYGFNRIMQNDNWPLATTMANGDMNVLSTSSTTNAVHNNDALVYSSPSTTHESDFYTIIKQEYNVSPSQSSSGLGSMSSPSPVTSRSFMPLSQVLMEENHDPLLATAINIKDEALSPHIMEISH
ncbi:transcription factor EC-like protein [Dinothrombium tinctorium]|uniref:Transcription factor EC-like protein n=1 Tax=Dinothrombium tinctorium TaxID=1965070 RepID=A0A3S3NUI8_9ACAR|nr:transcription factor EC-like protein [Dinothrombium tinctorium]RWS10118.1 transcription factor EC-like protein [Dinothrombium tinctorium]